MEPVTLPIDLNQVRTDAWDVFGDVILIMISQTPWWLWVIICIGVILRILTAAPELGKWLWRYGVRSSFLD